MNNTATAQHRPLDPDVTLVRRMAAGDARALDDLYAKYGPGVLGFLTTRLDDRQQAEEILQDVMLAAWRHAGDFRGDSSVKTWLLVIARNRAINAHRRHKPQIVAIDDDFELASNDTEPLEHMERNLTGAQVRHALELLPPAHREILTLVFFQQLSGPEVAEVLGINEGTVKSRLHRAKEALRRVLYGEGDL
jgi:RNA polymerase sigma-70 factor (ECF subfamily)